MACHAVNGLIDSFNRATRTEEVHITIGYGIFSCLLFIFS